MVYWEMPLSVTTKGHIDKPPEIPLVGTTTNTQQQQQKSCIVDDNNEIFNVVIEKTKTENGNTKSFLVLTKMKNCFPFSFLSIDHNIKIFIVVINDNDVIPTTTTTPHNHTNVMCSCVSEYCTLNGVRPDQNKRCQHIKHIHHNNTFIPLKGWDCRGIKKVCGKWHQTKKKHNGIVSVVEGNKLSF